MIKNPLIVFILLLHLSGAYAQQTEVPYVILVSFDGFRSDYVEKLDLPNFKKFIASGVSAEALIPSFPSKTFPNHYSIVTGMYPGHHGIVDNNFFDPSQQKSYSLKKKESARDSSFYGGTPLWKLCRMNGVRSASFFWVGSEAESKSRPDYYYEYKESTPFSARVDQVIAWLQLPSQERPHFITLYFSSPDYESHEWGPFADETKEQLRSLDSLFGSFTARLDATGLPINVVVVSDHGMSELRHQEDTYVFIDELIPARNNIRVVNGGTQAHVYVGNPQRADSLFTALTSQALTYAAVKCQDFPERWNYGNERSGDLLILAEPGHYIVNGSREKVMAESPVGKSFGVHGYDPQKVSEMSGIFYASGPAIKKGMTIPAFENIHIYPMIARILGLPIPTIDGKQNVLEIILR